MEARGMYDLLIAARNANARAQAVPDHKFDFVDITEFHSNSCGNRLGYAWLYTLVIKNGAVYIADIYTAVALLASGRWAASYLQSDETKSSNVLEVPFSIGKWIFTGCIIFSFLLLAWEARKARAIIKSRDISYAFTNVMSQNWYSLRDYNYYCFFSQIDNSKKKKDEFAFFIFFTFKSWKQLLLADAPRQVINAITLYSFGKSEGWTTDLSVYFGGSIFKSAIIITMLFTLVIWVGSALLLLVAAIMYVPLLCYIQGNLKEYCCHKVDKRIAELMKRKTRKRLAQEAKIQQAEARGDFRHLRDPRTGKFTKAPLPQPTLPKIGLDADDMRSDAGSMRYPPPSQRTGTPFNRSGYPYVTSDPDMSSGHHYAESFTSVDNLTRGAMPMGGYDSSLSLSAPGMQRAPTYTSQDEPYGYDVDEKFYGHGSHDDRTEVAGYYTDEPQQYVPQQRRPTGGNGGGGAPRSRQQLDDAYDDHSAIDIVDDYTYHQQLHDRYGGRHQQQQSSRDDLAWEDSYAASSAGDSYWEAARYRTQGR